MWLLNPYWYTRQYSAPVSDYLDRVIAADVAAGNLLGLEDATKTAYATFIDNLIVDGYLGVSGGTISQTSSVIKASPIMAGARTLAGALVPLVGTAPTNFNFVAGDYDRKTGPLGDGSTKYLNSNRNNNADPQNSKHLAVYFGSALPSASALSRTHMGVIGPSFSQAGASVISTDLIGATVDSGRYRVNGTTSAVISNGLSAGLKAVNRSNSSGLTVRQNSATTTVSSTSEAPLNNMLFVFARNATGAGGASAVDSYSNARIAFYSIGESLDLALLDARVSALITAFAAAIP